MKVVFYTATCFLDISIEVINILKKLVELHVIIEITPESKDHTISDVDNLTVNEVIVHPSKILTIKSWSYLAPYFEGTESVVFAIFKSKKTLPTINAWLKIGQYIKNINPNILHLEAMQIRSIGLVFNLFFCTKLLISVHDPIPHSGEKDLKLNLVKKLFYHFPITKDFIFYSHFAQTQFELYNRNIHNRKWILKMNPYMYFKNYKEGNIPFKKHLLFFGRLSPYKGIDVLLKAMPLVFNKFPNEILIIAGRSINGYSLDQETITNYEKNIKIINKHIPNEELVNLISNAKVIICPYIDATQSGVLMTSLALNTPVIASNTGAFSEYIEEDKNGLLVPVGDYNALAQKIISVLINDNYNIMSDYIEKKNKHTNWSIIEKTLKLAYLSK